MKNPVLTADFVRQRLAYDPDTGVLTWREGRRRGKAAASRDSRGYGRVMLNWRVYATHCVVWLHWYGVWPPGPLDHINGERADNRIANLRQVSQRLNTQNQRKAHRDSSTGLLGVSVDRRPQQRHKPYRAAIFHDGKLRHLGYFATPEDAYARYLTAKRARHPGCTL